MHKRESQMTKVTELNLFPIPLYKIRVTNHEKIKKYLMDHVYPVYVKRGPNDPIQNTFTDYGFTADAAFCNWDYLNKLYKDDFIDLLQATGINLAKHPWQIKLKGWYNFTNQNTAQFLHDHTGGPSLITFSAVHYVVLSDNSLPTVFKNPSMKYIRSVTPTKNLDYLPSYFFNFDNIPDCVEGDMIMFPSWLDHYVPQHINGNLRVTTAFNIMMRVDDGDGN